MEMTVIRTSGSLFYSGAVSRSQSVRQDAKRKRERKGRDPDSLRARLKRIFCFDQKEAESVPLVWTRQGSELTAKASEAGDDEQGVLEGEGGRGVLA